MIYNSHVLFSPTHVVRCHRIPTANQPPTTSSWHYLDNHFASSPADAGPSHSSSIPSLSPLCFCPPPLWHYCHSKCKTTVPPIIIHYYPHQATSKRGGSSKRFWISAEYRRRFIMVPNNQAIRTANQSSNNQLIMQHSVSHQQTSPELSSVPSRPHKMHNHNHSPVCKLYSAIQLLYSG